MVKRVRTTFKQKEVNFLVRPFRCHTHIALDDNGFPLFSPSLEHNIYLMCTTLINRT